MRTVAAAIKSPPRLTHAPAARWREGLRTWEMLCPQTVAERHLADEIWLNGFESRLIYFANLLSRQYHDVLDSTVILCYIFSGTQEPFLLTSQLPPTAAEHPQRGVSYQPPVHHRSLYYFFHNLEKITAHAPD